ncbi:MAG TPA: class I SAM-dependent methyltransferase [Acidimicrobiales bacterium]|nr:class I SAM-dependent methyltransferase [Acidimicrobiales bacterium]
MPFEHRSVRHTARRATRAGLWALAAVHVAEAVVLRQRRRQVTTLPAASADHSADVAGKVDITAVAGSRVDTATAAAARREMDASGAQVLDLVPGDLPVDRALRLLRRVEADKLGTDVYYAPGGAHEAVAVDPTVTARAGRSEEGRLDRGDLVRATLRAQRHAPKAARVRVAPGLAATPSNGRDRWRELEELTAYAQPYGALAPILVAAETVHLAALTAGLFVSPAAGLAALATWAAQPPIVFGGGTRSADRTATSLDGGAWRPPTITSAAAMRLPRAWVDNLRTVAAGWRDTQARQAERLAKPIPQAPPAHTLFETRRTTCYWCDSDDLAGRLIIGDLLQHKPGTFHLNECRSCGHVFQNPALTPAGLDHYYQDAYDGLGEELAEVSFAALGSIYRKRVEALARHAEPRAWLDVGTGHAHFLLAARERWPEATFDALDMSDSVSEAARRGRVDTAYRGMFPELAGTLPRSYDVVSMHHYLEHTRDPKRELAAAAQVVEPGGHLMIEVPDAEAPWARRLGRYWWQWGQPQHQHFMTCDNLVAELGRIGFEVVSVERGPATMGGELFNSIGLVLQHLVRSPHLPWLPVPSLAHRAGRVALYGAAVPAMLLTKIADEVKDAMLGPDDIGNAYRVVARRT